MGGGRTQAAPCSSASPRVVDAHTAAVVDARAVSLWYPRGLGVILSLAHVPHWPSEKRLGSQQMLSLKGMLRNEVGGQRCDGSAQAAGRSAAGGGTRQTLFGPCSVKRQQESDSLGSFITCHVVGSAEAASLVSANGTSAGHTSRRRGSGLRLRHFEGRVQAASQRGLSGVPRPLLSCPKFSPSPGVSPTLRLGSQAF